MGQIGCRFAMEQTLARAERHGIAACAIGGSNHCGALAPYAMQALAHEMIGVFTTHSLPIMAPWGGAARLIGSNPLRKDSERDARIYGEVAVELPRPLPGVINGGVY